MLSSPLRLHPQNSEKCSASSMPAVESILAQIMSSSSLMQLGKWSITLLMTEHASDLVAFNLDRHMDYKLGVFLDFLLFFTFKSIYL